MKNGTILNNESFKSLALKITGSNIVKRSRASSKFFYFSKFYTVFSLFVIYTYFIFIYKRFIRSCEKIFFKDQTVTDETLIFETAVWHRQRILHHM